MFPALLDKLRINESVEITELNSKEIFFKILKNIEHNEIIHIKSSKIDKNFQEVINSRRSERKFLPISLSHISAVLFDSARVIETSLSVDGLLRSLRPYPSAGGRHPLEIFCFSENIKGLNDGVWYFDPYKVQLELIRKPDVKYESTFLEAQELLGERPQCILVIVAVIERTLSRYKNGMNLIWKDVGNLSSLISFTSAAHNLKSCQIGISRDFDLHSDIQTNSPLWVVGGVAIGG